MDVPELIDRLEHEGALLAAATEGTDPSALVPGTAWDVRTLVVHTGAVHRWATDVIVRSLATNESGGSAAFAQDVPDDELRPWLEAGLATLVATLRAVGDDLQTFTFLRSPSSRYFWARRQAHETTIHRADVEAAAGRPVSPIDPAFAQDGLGELLAGFARGRTFASATSGRLGFVCTDGPGWLVAFGGERNLTVETDDFSSATATVTGTSAELYLWAWNRPSPAREVGDATTIGLWRRVRI